MTIPHMTVPRYEIIAVHNLNSEPRRIGSIGRYRDEFFGAYRDHVIKTAKLDMSMHIGRIVPPPRPCIHHSTLVHNLVDMQSIREGQLTQVIVMRNDVVEPTKEQNLSSACKSCSCESCPRERWV